MPISIIGSDGLASSAVTPTKLSQPLTLGTAVASTSGTSIDFTGIPSWVKRITVNLSGVSLSAGSNIVIQLGTSSTPKTSGYLGAYVTNTSAPAVAVVALSAGFVFSSTNSSALHNGSIVISLLNSASNTWSGFGIDSESSGGRITSVSGSVPLSGTLDMVRVTSSSTDTFDAGSINILYEG